MAKITYGRVPLYPYLDRFIHEKRQGFGWDDLGQRQPKFVVLHRMVGTLRGTDSYFRMPNISSYTDFGIGTAHSDGANYAGVIYRWNDPYGRRSPWASGPVNRPFGDGAAIVAKYGINAVNRDGISLEIGGHDEPIDDVTWNRIVHFIAYWADQLKVPYTSFPINPATGISFVIWHTEFTAGTGKECPFSWLKNRTGKLIEDVKNLLKKYQEGEGVVAPKPVAPAPAGVVKSDLKKGDKVVSRKGAVIRQGSATRYKQVAVLAEGIAMEVIDGPRNEDGHDWVDVKWAGGTGWTAVGNLNKREAPVLESYKKVNDVEFYYLGANRAGREFTLVEDAWSRQWASEESTKKTQYKKGAKVRGYYFAIGAERNNEQLWLVLGKDINTAERLHIEHVAERPF